MPIGTPEGFLDITNATLRTSVVGISNTGPTGELSVGSNFHVNTTASNVLQVVGNVSSHHMTIGEISLVPAHGLENVTEVGNTTPYTVSFSNATTGLATTSNLHVGGSLKVGVIDFFNPGLTLATVTNNSNVTPYTVDLRNATTGLVTTANVIVGKDLQVAGNVSLTGTGSIVVPVGTTAQRPATGLSGMVRFDSDLDALQIYNGTAWSSVGSMYATGGTLTTVDGYRIHSFTSSGDFVVSIAGVVEYLVIGGGGAGGWDHGGGGGAGGYISGSKHVSVGTHAIVIGAGGTGQSGGGDGNNTTALGLTALGGGGGGSRNTGNQAHENGRAGGSGGGSCEDSYTVGEALNDGSQGNLGGVSGGGTPGNGAGGGGAGGTGGKSTGGAGSGYSGQGGAGLSSSITGTAVCRAGGGSGGRWSAGAIGAATGGGGTGGATGATNSTSAAANTGGGGGGAGITAGNAGAGGSGVVIIRYKM
jgi:hypothetical protein